MAHAPHAPHDPPTLDREEVARFARLSGQWWDERGPFRQLHRINPVRLTYIRDQLCRRFGRDAKGPASLSGLSVLDIGCGGGLVCEPLARLGAIRHRHRPCGGEHRGCQGPCLGRRPRHRL